MQGVGLYINWRDGNTTWVALKDIREAHPFQLSKYAVTDKITTEPAFDWWLPHTLKKRNNKIAKMKPKYGLKTKKFWIKVPKNTKQAIIFDLDNGNTLW